MGTDLLEVHPLELRFVVEAKQQSSCSIQLGNKSDQHVVFKVKTTSPKKYCVRPNEGIMKPSGTCVVTVTMHVQRATQLDLQCKDKFLIQCTVVPSTTSEEDITSDMFAKVSDRYIEERKMKVLLISPPQSSVLAPVNGLVNQDPSNDFSQKDNVLDGVENLPPTHKESDGLKYTKPTEGLRVTNDAGIMLAESTHELATAKSVDSREVNDGKDIKPSINEMDELKKQSEDVMSIINNLETKLAQAEQTVAKLKEERKKAMQETTIVKREFILMKRKLGGKAVHIGFPLLYICMVALICLMLGYLMQ